MSENDEPTKNMLEFIRVLLSRSMDEEQAKNLKDDEIAWMAPIVRYELNQLKAIYEDAIVFRYGIYGREPLSFEKVGIAIDEDKPLSSEQVQQVIAHAVKKLSVAIRRMRPDEYRLYALLSGKEDATPVLSAGEFPIADELDTVIDCVKRLQFKDNVASFILERYRQSLDEKGKE